jgi:hypothetical protein
MEKIEKISTLKFEKMAIPLEKNGKNWNMPWKCEMKNLNILIFEIWNEKNIFLNFELKFSFEILKMATLPEGNEKNIEMKKSYSSFGPLRKNFQ